MNEPLQPPEDEGRTLAIPQMGLVVLVGVSGSGKSSFAARHFRHTQVISSDFCRGLVSDNENDQPATSAAFDLLHHIVGVRLRRGLLTVVDATNVQSKARDQLVRLAKQHDVLASAIVLEVPVNVARERNRSRPDRDFGDHVLPRQQRELRSGLKNLRKQGFSRVHILRGTEEVDRAALSLEPLWNDKREHTGPFDVIGDVHGCRQELEALLTRLDYTIERDPLGQATGARHPDRTAVFVGDLVDRGPDTPGVLRLVMGMVEAGTALCVAGNHENKLVRALNGRNVKVAHGLAETLEQLGAEPDEFREAVRQFCDGLVAHYVLDDGNLVVAHAGLKEEYQGRASGRVRSFALYGETTGETDEYGLPVRYPWAKEYRGRATVVYGHTPVPEAEWVNNTICLDTGCAFGGRLTALRYPERELVDVPAEHTWYEPARPFLAEGTDAAPAADSATREPGLIDIDDVPVGPDTSETTEPGYPSGGVVDTRHGSVRVPGEHAMAALEVMSRFAADPRWLLYLPPTMAPAPTATDGDLLERPEEAFTHYRNVGLDRVVCQEKHMGSRAVAVVCRDEEAARRRFVPGSAGAVYTRTGRSFFADSATEEAVLAQLRSAIGAAGLWDEFGTDWIALDGELLPWSAKAEGLIRDQYAALGAAARSALPAAREVLSAAAERGLDVAALGEEVAARDSDIEAFSQVYRRYTWHTDGVEGLRYAPFAVLAAEGASFTDRDHDWHMSVAERLTGHGDLVIGTRHRTVDLTDPASTSAASQWWSELVENGGEGMVVKPWAGAQATGTKGLLQPGLKVRGPEYLRIIYGPDYLRPERLAKLRQRGLGRKSALALREHKLGLESLTRHARGDGMWRVHQPVFAVLAMESEPVDPRL